MKLASYAYQGRASYGVVRDDGIVDVPSHWPDGPGTLLEAMRDSQAAMARIASLAKAPGEMIPLEQVKLLAPLQQPPKLIGLAVNYVEHHNEYDRGHALPDDPKFHTTPRPFLMPSTCVIGPGDEIPWPCYSRQIDYEIELAVVIGSRAKCVSAKEARRCIFGYTIANDVSARSCTFAAGREKRPRDDFFDWLHGKWADGFCPLGPWIVTADEVGDPMNLQLELTVNGLTRQQSRTSAMIFDVYELVSFISHVMTLTPGDVIATGTPSGVGLATGNYLKGGDEIACRIEKIGQLNNRLSPTPTSFYQPCGESP
jgi:2-keto-4-pentenoate hydratase/2-oxohepta-3-ene-1,7-dioic acid hydratase in catechol pathway